MNVLIVFFTSLIVGRFGCMSKYGIIRLPSAIIFFIGIFVSSIMFLKEFIFMV